jgi:hypothetical protein
VPDLSARVIVLERLGRLNEFMVDWIATGPLGIPLEIVWADDIYEDPGEGCYQSHVKALDHDGPLLIMEDDCWFPERVDVLGLKYPDCDVFYLGGQHFQAPTDVLGWPGIVNCIGETNRSNAYIVTEPRKLRDLFVNDRKDLYPDIAMTRYPQLVRLGLMPWIAGQRACWSSIKMQDQPDRMWQWESVAP